MRRALRALLRDGGYAALVVTVVALAVGANTAVFTVAYGALFAPLPYRAPGELVRVATQFPTMGFDKFWISAPEYLEYREWSASFAEAGAFNTGMASVVGAGEPFRAQQARLHGEPLPDPRNLGLAGAGLHRRRGPSGGGAGHGPLRRALEARVRCGSGHPRPAAYGGRRPADRDRRPAAPSGPPRPARRVLDPARPRPRGPARPRVPQLHHGGAARPGDHDRSGPRRAPRTAGALALRVRGYPRAASRVPSRDPRGPPRGGRRRPGRPPHRVARAVGAAAARRLREPGQPDRGPRRVAAGRHRAPRRPRRGPRGRRGAVPAGGDSAFGRRRGAGVAVGAGGSVRAARRLSGRGPAHRGDRDLGPGPGLRPPRYRAHRRRVQRGADRRAGHGGTRVPAPQHPAGGRKARHRRPQPVPERARGVRGGAVRSAADRLPPSWSAACSRSRRRTPGSTRRTSRRTRPTCRRPRIRRPPSSSRSSSGSARRPRRFPASRRSPT